MPDSHPDVLDFVFELRDLEHFLVEEAVLEHLSGHGEPKKLGFSCQLVDMRVEFFFVIDPDGHDLAEKVYFVRFVVVLFDQEVEEAPEAGGALVLHFFFVDPAVPLLLLQMLFVFFVQPEPLVLELAELVF